MNNNILIMGVTGMLGNNIYKFLKDKFNVYGTCRKLYNLKDDNIYCFDHTIENIKSIIQNLKPKVILNCIAILKANNNEEKNKMIFANCVIPFEISNYCKKNNIYFIHFSSDAVFNSSNLFHKINESYSPQTFYGLTKSISENISTESLVLRICPIGFDKFKKKSLFNFIYDNKENKINGFKNCFFNGTTSIVIAKEIIKIINNKNRLYGIHHLTGPKISKLELLKMINEQFNLKKEIIELNEPKISRLLIDDLIDSKEINWKDMINELKIFVLNN